MKTGKYKLVEASKGKSGCGIGSHASDVTEHKREWGQKLLGNALEEVREGICVKEPGKHPEDRDRQYFENIEK